jgi:hypothetical protein
MPTFSTSNIISAAAAQLCCPVLSSPAYHRTSLARLLSSFGFSTAEKTASAEKHLIAEAVDFRFSM